MKFDPKPNDSNPLSKRSKAQLNDSAGLIDRSMRQRKSLMNIDIEGLKQNNTNSGKFLGM
jgi:hypothetical protein